MAHYKTESLAEYHHIGDALAPKEIWNEIFPKLSIGMQDITMIVQEGPRDQFVVKPDQQRITVQPSAQIRQGVFLQMNDHHGLGAEGKPLKSAGDASQLTRKCWASTYKQSQEVFDRILLSALATQKGATAK